MNARLDSPDAYADKGLLLAEQLVVLFEGAQFPYGPPVDITAVLVGALLAELLERDRLTVAWRPDLNEHVININERGSVFDGLLNEALAHVATEASIAEELTVRASGGGPRLLAVRRRLARSPAARLRAFPERWQTPRLQLHRVSEHFGHGLYARIRERLVQAHILRAPVINASGEQTIPDRRIIDGELHDGLLDQIRTHIFAAPPPPGAAARYLVALCGSEIMWPRLAVSRSHDEASQAFEQGWAAMADDPIAQAVNAVKNRVEARADGADPFLWEFDRRFGERA